MYEAYEKGISPNDWRKILSTDSRFIREMREMKNEKNIRIKNKQNLMREMGMF